MENIDNKVFEYTLNFARESRIEVEPENLKVGIRRHMDSARNVVTTATLERIGHVHLSLMINTAARYGLSLGEVIMTGVRNGCQPVASICTTLLKKKTGHSKSDFDQIKKKPHLYLV